jgi:excisionase family DNA binding protein
MIDGAVPPRDSDHHMSEDSAMTLSPDANPPEAGRQPRDAERLALSVVEASRALGISASLGYELVARGKLPAVRLGRRVVVPRAALERLLDGRDVDS